MTLTDAGRELAEKATEVLNRDVFSQPGLGPAGVEVLLGQLDDLRHDAGDY